MLLEEMFGLDLRSLAVFRMGVAAVMLGDLLVRVTDLRAFYTDAGVLPRAVLLAKTPYPWSISVHLLNGTPLFQALLFFIAMGAAIGLLAGYRTPWMTGLCWFLTVSLHARNFLILQGGDDYLKMCLFWALFLPLGARYSIDSLLNSSTEKIPTRILSWGSIALVTQTILLYVSTAIFKSRGSSWTDGSALYYALSLDYFAKRPAFLLLLFPTLLQYMTFGVLAFESFGSFLLISPIWNGPLRTLAVFGFLSLHFGIMMTMAIGPFQWVSIVAALAFLPPWFWENAARLLGDHKRSWDIPLLRDAWRKRALPLISQLPRRPIRITPSRFSGPVVIFFLFCVSWWDVSLLYPDRYPLPTALNNFCVAMNITQRWAMFSPNISKTSGWFVIPGKLRDGKVVDLFQNGQPLSWAPPPLISAHYRNERWRKYLMNMRISRMRSYRIDFSQYLCQQWNQTHEGDDTLESLQVVFVDRHLVSGFQTTTHEQTVLWDTYCSAANRDQGIPLPTRVAPHKHEVMASPYVNNR